MSVFHRAAVFLTLDQPCPLSCSQEHSRSRRITFRTSRWTPSKNQHHLCIAHDIHSDHASPPVGAADFSPSASAPSCALLAGALSALGSVFVCAASPSGASSSLESSLLGAGSCKTSRSKSSSFSSSSSISSSLLSSHQYLHLCRHLINFIIFVVIIINIIIFVVIVGNIITINQPLGRLIINTIITSQIL